MKTPVKYSLAELTKGLDVVIKGMTDCLIEGVSTIQDARSGHISFLTNPLYRKFLPDTQATAIILSKEHAEGCLVTAIVTANPHYIYAKIAAYFDKRPKTVAAIHPSAVIGNDCHIPASVSIGARCVIEDGVKLGEHVRIAPGCIIGELTEIGES